MAEIAPFSLWDLSLFCSLHKLFFIMAEVGLNGKNESYQGPQGLLKPGLEFAQFCHILLDKDITSPWAKGENTKTS